MSTVVCSEVKSGREGEREGRMEGLPGGGRSVLRLPEPNLWKGWSGCAVDFWS